MRTKAELKRLIEMATIQGFQDDVDFFTKELQELNRKENKK